MESPHPLSMGNNAPVRRRTHSGKSRLADVLNATRGAVMTGSDLGWAMKLKAAVDCAARELNVEVIAAKPVPMRSSDLDEDMVFVMDTDRGRLQAIRSKSGQHVFHWIREE